MGHFLLIFFVARYLRKTLTNEPGFNEWDEKLKYAMIISIVAFGASLPLHDSMLMEWVADVVMLFCIYILYTRPFFKTAKSILLALAPYAIVSILVGTIKLVLTSFYKSEKSVFDSLEVFAVLWGVGVWIVTLRQRKELSKAKKEVETQEQNNKMITAMKAELEVQVAERTAELRMQKEELEHTLDELRSTQAQLIQSEKMASLGELTAGIAHEIQNPLNFVNNFSEVNNELIEELKSERQKEDGKRDIEIENEILHDITQNNTKISFHGRRADAIVKSMLQHSRKSTGQKESTDINELCDEYLRLSYHGLRAKDKSFNVEFKTDFDSSIGKMDVVPQDIGRVLLNLFNNAFYAVNEKKKSAGENYHPTVIVTTKRSHAEGGDEVLITVKDNGNGVPQNIVDKIFQPFFTTKPTGIGTGLGLSLAYDIIKAHGGELKVNTKDGEGSEFMIELPF
jgi:signal transduction histidine kinase